MMPPLDFRDYAMWVYYRSAGHCSLGVAGVGFPDITHYNGLIVTGSRTYLMFWHIVRSLCNDVRVGNGLKIVSESYVRDQRLYHTSSTPQHAFWCITWILVHNMSSGTQHEFSYTTWALVHMSSGKQHHMSSKDEANWRWPMLPWGTPPPQKKKTPNITWVLAHNMSSRTHEFWHTTWVRRCRLFIQIITLVSCLYDNGMSYILSPLHSPVWGLP